MNFNFKIENFSLKVSLTCGQCFRYKILNADEYLVFAKDHSSIVKQLGNDLFFSASDCGPEFWKNYFDIYTDYGKLLNNFNGDIVLERAKKFCSGIHIFKQDPWETLISFIISINNNIPRIKSIVERLCVN